MVVTQTKQLNVICLSQVFQDNKSKFMKRISILSVLLWMITILSVTACDSKAKKKPNFIIIFTDDQGYQDLGCYGSPDIKTPNLDQLAESGIRATDFYVSESVCSPSRASLLTGMYPIHNGVKGVFFPDSRGMDTEEVTIAEVLKPLGYKTACFGKWHLGDLVDNLPTAQGFDEYFGIPYSNDMFIGAKMNFADDVKFRNGYNLDRAKADQKLVSKYRTDRNKLKKLGIKELSPLMEGNKIVEYPCDQGSLTKRYFQRAIKFIEKSGEEPFFIYLTPTMPHVPLWASEKFKNKSKGGLYGDVVEEIDFYVGELKRALKSQGIDENTAIIFASDNGPWLGYGNHAGHATPLREGKFTNYEGGVRVPCIFNWPGTWDSGKKTDNILLTIDLFPTLAYYAGVKSLKTGVDGINIYEHLENTGVPLKRTSLFYFLNGEVHGIRNGKWKYLPYSGARGANKDCKPELFNLKEDISESNNVYDQYPEIVKKMQNKLEEYEINNNVEL